MLRRTTLCAMAVLVLAQVACSKEDSKGHALGLPQVKPPVANNTPAGIKSAALRLVDSNSALAVLSSRLFSGGPTNILDRLGKIDERLAEMDTRSQEEEKACLAAAATDWTQPAALPGGTSFPLAFQCLDSFETNGVSKMQIAFGVNNGFANMAEIQQRLGEASTAPQVASLVRAKMDGTSTEAWITMQGFDNSQSVTADDYFFLAIKGDSSTKAFEVSVGGTGKGIGVDCGVRVMSDGVSVYAKGVFASFHDLGTEDCTGSGASGTAAATDLCADATTLAAVDAANCANLKNFTLPEMTHSGLEAGGAKAASDAFIGATITGIQAFATKK